MPAGPLGQCGPNLLAQAKTLPSCLPGALGEELLGLRGWKGHVLPAPGSPGGAERSLSALAGSGKGFRKWMGNRAAQLPPLKAWLGLAAKPTLCPTQRGECWLGQASPSPLANQGLIGNPRCRLRPGLCC